MQHLPCAVIRYIVGNHHVSEPDAAIVDDISARAIKAGWTPEEIARALRYAVRVHQANRALYIRLGNGQFGKDKRGQS